MKKNLLKLLFIAIVCMTSEKANAAVSVTFTAVPGNASSYLMQGTTNQVVFGFKMVVSGGSYNPMNFHILAGNATNSQFTGKLAQLTTQNPTLAATAIPSYGVQSFGSTIDINGPNVTYPTGTYYFYLVLNVLVNTNGGLSNTWTFALPSGTGVAQNTTGISTVTNLSTPATYYSGQIYTWYGSSSTWGLNTNWRDGAGHANNVPGQYDVARIGVTAGYSFAPVVNSNASIGVIIIGNVTSGTVTPSITVNSGVTLTVTDNITKQGDNWSSSSFPTPLTGSGVIKAKAIYISDDNPDVRTYTNLLTSSVDTLSVKNIILSTSLIPWAGTDYYHNATFNVTGGTTKVSDAIQTINITGAIPPSGTTSTINVSNGTLQLAGATALSGLSTSGKNVLTLGTGSTIEYSGSTQTIYTDAAISGLATGPSYQNIKFSGLTGTKTPNSGNLNVAGDFTNNFKGSSLALSTIPVLFNGTTAQSLSNGSGSTTLFKNVTFQNAGVKTISGAGNFNVISSGTLTMAASTTLAAGGGLTLNSDINGSAIVAEIPPTAKITGNVNVERYISGNSANSRGYRLLSSAVSAATNNLVLPNLSYIKSNAYITGTTGTGGNFDATGNPALYFYREDLAPNYSSFLTSNFRGVNKINNGNLYDFSNDNEAGTHTLPAGNGFLFFFRGDKATTVNPTVTSSIAKPTTFKNTGVLNQGTIAVKHWYSGSTNLQFNLTTGNDNVRGFNLVGNPYASSINWDKLGTDITGVRILTTIWIYNPTKKVYATYIASSSGVGTNFNGTSNTANIIPSGQGFFVRGTAANPTLTFTEKAKVSDQVASTNLLMSTGTVAKTEPLQYLRLQLYKDSLNNEDALIFLKNSSTDTYVQDEDAEYLKGNNTVTMSTFSSDKKNLAINAIPYPKKTQTMIPVNANISASGLYQINLSEAKNVPDLYEIYLMDALKKDSLDILTNKTYNFNAVAGDSTTFGNKRFKLIIRQKTSMTLRLLDFAAVKITQGVQLSWVTENEKSYTNFTVERSIDGGKTFELIGGYSSSDIGKYILVDKAPVIGVNQYRLKQDDVNGTITYSKVVPLMYSNSSNNITASIITVFPNPVTTTVNVSVAQQDKPSDYNIRITNGLGTVVRSVTTSQNIWQDNVSDFSPGTYFVQVVNNVTKAIIGTGKFSK